MTSIGSLVVLAGLVAPAAAHAEEPAVARAREANLESTERIRSTMVTLAAGGSVNLGIGVSDVGGQGGAGSLRLAHVMTPRWLLDVELSTSAMLHQTMAAGDSTLYTNNATGFMVGAQYFVGPAFWLRGATGLGVYIAQNSDLDGDHVQNDPSRLGAIAGLGGAGLELARFRHVSVGVETFVLSLVTRTGIIAGGGLLLGVSVY